MPLVLPNNFAQKFWHLASAHKGTQDNVFSQSAYIEHNKLAKNLSGGVCMTLAMIWNSCRGSDGMFFEYINTKKGKSKVQGVHSLYKIAGDKSLGSVNAVKEHLRNMGNRFVEKFKLGKNTNSGKSQVEIADLAKSPGLYQLHFWGKGGGHAIAFRCQPQGYKVFDPNAGTVTFPEFSMMTQFIDNLIANCYNDLASGWLAMKIDRKV